MECNLQRLERKKKLFSWAKGRQSDVFETEEFWAREMRSVINMVLKNYLGGRPGSQFCLLSTV